MEDTVLIRKLTIAFGLSLLCVSLTLAQGGDCPDIVQTALAQVGDVCANTGRNQACYGNGAITAQFAPAANVKFDAPGDLGDLAAVQILQLGALDEDTGTWGVAMLKVQANLPDTNPGQNVTMLLFGDVQFADAAAVDGATPDPNADPDATFNPMQAFYFTAGIGDSPCAEAPDSGILIQTPQGAGTVQLRVNAVDIELGSTAYLTANGTMDVYLLEGQAQVTAFDTTVTVPAGSVVSVPLDDTGAASAAPGDVQPFDAALSTDTAALAALLPDPLTAASPCTLTAADAVNLRAGPGTNYDRAGGLNAGDTADADAQASGADGRTWYRLADGRWVRADVIEAGDGCAGLPVTADVPPTPTPAPAASAPGGGRGGSSINVYVGFPSGCNPDTVPSGVPLTVTYGMGYGPNQADAEAGINDPHGLTVDGVPLTQTRAAVEWHGDQWGVGRYFDWGTPPPGTYNLVATDRSQLRPCTVTVTP